MSVKITDTSVRAFGKKYSGSVVLYLGETDFGTTIVGNSPRTSLQLSVNTLGLFLTDDTATLTEPGIADKASSNIGGIGWKVCRAYTHPLTDLNELYSGKATHSWRSWPTLTCNSPVTSA